LFKNNHFVLKSEKTTLPRVPDETNRYKKHL